MYGVKHAPMEVTWIISKSGSRLIVTVHRDVGMFVNMHEDRAYLLMGKEIGRFVSVRYEGIYM